MELGYKGRRRADSSINFEDQEFNADNSLLSQVMSASRPQVDVPSSVPQLSKYEPQEPTSNRSAFEGGDYLQKLAQVESNGDWNAMNPGSKAFGRFQFIPSTEKTYAKKLGMSLDQARTPEGQMRMVSAFTADNRNGLLKAGIEPTQENLYLAHQQGLGGAINLIRGRGTKQINLTSNGVNNYAEWRKKFGSRFA